MSYKYGIEKPLHSSYLLQLRVLYFYGTVYGIFVAKEKKEKREEQMLIL